MKYKGVNLEKVKKDIKFEEDFYDEVEDKIQCLECKAEGIERWFKEITWTHLRKYHERMTCGEYREKWVIKRGYLHCKEARAKRAIANFKNENLKALYEERRKNPDILKKNMEKYRGEINKGLYKWRAIYGKKPHYLKRISEEELKNKLLNLRKKLGRWPNTEDIDKYPGPKASTYYYRYGNILKAYEHFGWNYETKYGPERIPEEELKNKLLNLKEILGRWPTLYDIDKYPGPKRGTYCKRYGSILKAYEHFGFF